MLTLLEPLKFARRFVTDFGVHFVSDFAFQFRCDLAFQFWCDLAFRFGVDILPTLGPFGGAVATKVEATKPRGRTFFLCVWRNVTHFPVGKSGPTRLLPGRELAKKSIAKLANFRHPIWMKSGHVIWMKFWHSIWNKFWYVIWKKFWYTIWTKFGYVILGKLGAQFWSNHELRCS